MARRSFSDFFKAFNEGFDTVNKVGKDYELSKLAQEKETQAYTADQGAELEAMANAKDADGNPYYTVGNDPTGKYTVTPNFKNETGAAPAEYTPSTMAAKGVSYMGQNFDAPLSDTQRNGARAQAMAGVMEKYGDAEGAMRYRHQAQQGVLMDKQLQQADLQMDQSKRVALREDKADAYETSRQVAFDGSVFGQQNAAYAKQFQEFIAAKSKYEAGVAAGQPPESLGLPPQQPARAAYSLADSLADQGSLLANDAKHGKVDAKTLGAFSESMRKIEDEGYLKALNLAQGGGSINDVAKAFNSGGQLKFDPKSVLSDKMVPGQGGVPERVISFKDEGGNTQTINVMAQLKSLGKANEALSQFYAGETNRRGNAGEVRADKSLVLQERTVGIQAGNAAVSNELGRANIAEIKQKTEDRKTQSDLTKVYGEAIDSGDPKAIDSAAKKIHIFNRSGKGGESKSAFAEKVDLLMRANPEWTLAKAASVAGEKAGQSPDAYFAELMKPSAGMSMPIKDAEAITKAAYPDWRAAAAANGVTGAAQPGRSASGKAASQGAPVKVSTQADYSKLKSGTSYIAPDGSTRTKP